MHFRLVYITRNMGLERHVLKVHDPHHKVDLIVRERAKDEDGPKYVIGDGVCEASCEREVSARLESEAREKGTVSERKGQVERAETEMYEALCRTLRVLRWRHARPAHHNPIRTLHRFDWSFDGVEWVAVIRDIRLDVSLGIPCEQWSADLLPSVEQLIVEHQREPIGHELYREASSHEDDHPRSAVVLAVAAAEIGFKQFVAKSVPQSQWLVENLPSPPLVRMLTDFLPGIPLPITKADRQPFVPDLILRELEKAVLVRNQLVHGRRNTVERDSAHSILWAVHDFLYLLDFYSGQTWALKNLRAECQQEIAAAFLCP